MPSKDEIYINKEGYSYNEFYSVSNTVIHEGMHAFQSFIISHAEVIENNPELLIQRNIFESNFGNGMIATIDKGYVFYRNNPTEKDAWDVGDNFEQELKSLLDHD